MYGIPRLTIACDRCERLWKVATCICIVWVARREVWNGFLSIMADQCPCVDTIQTLWSGDRGHYATCHHATTLEFFNFDIGSVMNTQYSERGLNLNWDPLRLRSCDGQSHILKDLFWPNCPFVEKHPNYDMGTSWLNAFFEIYKFLAVSMTKLRNATAHRPPPSTRGFLEPRLSHSDYRLLRYDACSMQRSRQHTT